MKYREVKKYLFKIVESILFIKVEYDIINLVQPDTS